METLNCLICLEDLKPKEIKGSYFCPNNHLFHSNCAWIWLKHKLDGYNSTVNNRRWSCPSCRHIPTSRRMLDHLINENLKNKEDKKHYYKNILNAPYPPGLLDGLSDFDLNDLLALTTKLLSLLLTGIVITAYIHLCVAYKVSRIVHRYFALSINMDEQRLFIIEMNIALLALIILSL